VLRAALISVAVAVPAFAQSYVDDCGLEPPETATHVVVPPKPGEVPWHRGEPAGARRELPGLELRIGGVPTAHRTASGALSGKTIYLSPGHGFTWTVGTTSSVWSTQRGNSFGIVEDLVSIETLDQFLIPMLLNAGAEVVSAREADINPAMVIVDNSGPGYAETGPAGTFSDSTLTAFGLPTFPLDGATTPFELGGNRLMNASATQTASATFTAALPRDDFYNVYVSYAAYTARVTDAHYVVKHAGGETHFRVNQQHHGKTWALLGRFYFKAGTPAVVAVLNDSATPTGNVSLDAVRFGGGMGFFDRGGGTTGRPEFETSARYHAQWAGAPATVWSAYGNTPADDRTNDVSTRSRFAAWVHETGEDAVYVAWHTNAAGTSPSTATGTSTYVYGPNPPDGTYQFTGVAGSDRLGQLVHTQLIGDFRSPNGWNVPNYGDRGLLSAYFGELNPTHNPETPAILVEVDFHDSMVGSSRIKEPMWRYVATRAFAHGIIKYFAEKDGVTLHLPPEAPTHPTAVNQGGGQVLVSWHAGPADAAGGVRGEAATQFRVSSSADGLGWDEGQLVPATAQAVQTLQVAVPAGQARFFRVSGLNDGGESFPSAVVGARAPTQGQPMALVVNAYDRMESSIGRTEDMTAWGLGSVLRIFLPRMNDGSSTRVWGDALDANQVGFDSASVEAIAAGDVPLAPYTLLAWFAGRGHSGGAAPTPGEQAVISGRRSAAVPVLFSGRAVNDATFLQSVLMGANAAGAGSHDVAGAGVLQGLGWQLDDGDGGSYDTASPDVVAPGSGSVSLGGYSGGAGAAIGVQNQIAFLAFPFETITDRATRVEIIRRLLGFLSPLGVDGGVPVVDGGSGGGTGGGSGGGGGAGGGSGGGTAEPATLGAVPGQYKAAGCGCGTAPAAPLLALGLLGLARRRRVRRS